MKHVIHKAEERGHANHGWLNAHHSFSFADWYDPHKIHFGMLRVLNDDVIAGDKGFGMHPHDNMEIVTIMRKGSLEHRDSMGHQEIIHAGEVQVMSAGTGIMHSEKNALKDQEVRLFQIWIFPNEKNVTPRYDKVILDEKKLHNNFINIISPPGKNKEGSWIHQNAWFNLGKIDKGKTFDYNLQLKGNGVYAFIIEGEAKVNGFDLKKRDAVGLWETDKFSVDSLSDDMEILLMEIPMN